MTDQPEKPTTTASARVTDPITSHLAALIVEKTRLEQIVLSCLTTHRGRYMTSIEVAKETGLDKWSVSPRFRPLFNKGLLLAPIRVQGLNSAGHIRWLQAWAVI